MLLKAALYDDSVANAHFAPLSESDLPLYHGSVMFWLLLAARRRRRTSCAGAGCGFFWHYMSITDARSHHTKHAVHAHAFRSSKAQTEACLCEGART
jgi:hypothetical protein